MPVPLQSFSPRYLGGHFAPTLLRIWPQLRESHIVQALCRAATYSWIDPTRVSLKRALALRRLKV
jgi:hypothetical protein